MFRAKISEIEVAGWWEQFSAVSPEDFAAAVSSCIAKERFFPHVATVKAHLPRRSTIPDAAETSRQLASYARCARHRADATAKITPDTIVEWCTVCIGQLGQMPGGKQLVAIAQKRADRSTAEIREHWRQFFARESKGGYILQGDPRLGGAK